MRKWSKKRPLPYPRTKMMYWNWSIVCEILFVVSLVSCSRMEEDVGELGSELFFFVGFSLFLAAVYCRAKSRPTESDQSEDS
jgi:hypothetical protein